MVAAAGARGHAAVSERRNAGGVMTSFFVFFCVMITTGLAARAQTVCSNSTLQPGGVEDL